MPLITYLLLFVYLPLTASSNDSVLNESYQKGEYLKYRVHYGWVTGGYAVLEVSENTENINGSSCYHASISGYSVGMTDWLFKVKDKYESYIDEKTLLPQKHTRDIREGKYRSKNVVTFDHEKNTAMSEKSGLHTLPDNIQDIVSAVYYLRSCALKNFNQGDTIIIQSFFDDELFPLAVRHLGVENVKTEFGTIRCLKLIPMVQKGRIFKSQEDMTIWITDDKNHLPVQIKSDLLVGSLKFDLIEYKGEKNKLNFIQK